MFNWPFSGMYSVLNLVDGNLQSNCGRRDRASHPLRLSSVGVVAGTRAEKLVTWCPAAELSVGDGLQCVAWQNGATVILQPLRS